jgi:hypothetical protein
MQDPTPVRFNTKIDFLKPIPTNRAHWREAWLDIAAAIAYKLENDDLPGDN